MVTRPQAAAFLCLIAAMLCDALQRRATVRNLCHCPPARDDIAKPTPPPQIIHIDIEHFLDWFEVASQSERIGERNSIRIDVIAGDMQDHWVTICRDTDRDMAACPDCDGLSLFRRGGFRRGAATLSQTGGLFHGPTCDHRWTGS